MTHTNDRNLLLGILALQNDLVTRDHLIEAMNAWAVAKDRPLGQILVEQGALDREHRKLLEQLLDVHVQRHGSVQESLAGCELTSSVRFALECVPDAAVQTSIRSLRQRCEPAGVVDATRTFTGPTPIGAPLSEIRYRILRPHAKGGLGEVFVAEDLELHREVALKEIQRQHADQDTSRGRFVLEAEITGGLEHPGIVPVYGLGSYADGRPFYAMRFIKGDNLKYAIARFHQSATRFNGLEFRQLLGRFIDVCNAVAYAHSRGVLHRDLKPGNIMLGKFGETLVVDWGLAKVVGRADSSGEELTLAPISGSGVAETIQGMAMGTPAYMSPEQAMGKVAELGPATDVYSLGATLYALLINRPPILDEDLATALQKVQSGDIPRPRSLNAAIPKPLEAVCLKAMAMHPDQRHASAVALGEDIEHWLADEPVTAYHENVWQRVGRWSRRNREWTRAGAALMAMVIVFTVAILLVNRARQAAINLANKNDTIARQEQLAKREAITRLREARQTVDTWLTEMSGTLQYYPLMREVRTRLLQQAVEQYQQVATQLGDDPELKLERARANLSLSDVQRQLVDMEGAQRACGAALTLLNDMLRAPAPAPEVVEEWANGQRRLGLIHADMGDEIASDAAYRAAMERLGQVPDDAQQRTTYTETLASVLTNWSELAMAHGHSADATTRLDQARQLFEGLVQRAPKEPRHKLSLATILTILARLEMSAGRYREAQGNWATALAVLDDVVHQFPDQPKFRETRASTRLEAASLLRLQGKYEEELTVYEVILADFSALQKALPDVPSYRESIALTHTDLAQALRELGRNPEALASLELAGPVLDQLTIEYPTEPRYYEAHATCRDILAQTLLDLNKPADAKAQRGGRCRILSASGESVCGCAGIPRTARSLPEPSGTGIAPVARPGGTLGVRGRHSPARCAR